MYRRIVVPLDRSTFAERAIAPAAAVAESTGGELILLAAGIDGADEYLREQADGLPVAATVSTTDDADAAAAIIGLAGPDTLVSMASHGRTGVRRAVVGSVTEAVLRGVHQPVLVTGPLAGRTVEGRGGVMVVPLDGSERAEAILPVVRRWAEAFEMHVWLVSIVDPEWEARDDLDNDVLDSGYLAATAHTLGLPAGRVDWEVLHEPSPAQAIAAAASRLDASVVAMATHGRTGLSRVALGSVAMEIVGDAPCSALIVRPSAV